MKKICAFLYQYPRLSTIIAVAWTLLIFIGCSLPGSDIPKIGLFGQFDKVVHFTFFFIFFTLWRIRYRNKNNASLTLFLLSVIYGFGLEFYQLHFVAGRSFDVWDGIWDSIGAAVGWAFTIVFLHKRMN